MLAIKSILRSKNVSYFWGTVNIYFSATHQRIVHAFERIAKRKWRKCTDHILLQSEEFWKEYVRKFPEAKEEVTINRERGLCIKHPKRRQLHKKISNTCKIQIKTNKKAKGRVKKKRERSWVKIWIVAASALQCTVCGAYNVVNKPLIGMHMNFIVATSAPSVVHYNVVNTPLIGTCTLGPKTCMLD